MTIILITEESQNILLKKYRYKIAKTIREGTGRDFIILGNINWEKQTDTHEFINGVFFRIMEKKQEVVILVSK